MLISSIIAFILRIVLSFLPGISFDMGAWFGWANRLVNLPWRDFYSPEVWTHYTPGYFYVLFLLEKIETLLGSFFSFSLSGAGREVLYKLPANLVDIATGFLIYKILEKQSKKLAFWGTVFYLFNLAVILNSSVWGQIDSILTFLMLLTVYFLMNQRVFLASGFYAASFLVKPQALFLAPVFFFLLLDQKNKKNWLKFGLVFFLVVFFFSLPFFRTDPFFGLGKLIIQMSQDYPGTTLNAFNFWYLFGNWQSDQTTVFGLTKYYWGLGLFFLFETLILLKAFWKRNFLKQKNNLFLLASLLLLNFFLFPTRIHERYLLPFFAFFVIFAFNRRSLKLILIYLGLSLIHFFNLYYVYCSYQPNFLKIEPLFNLITNFGPFFSLTTVIFFLYLFYLFYSEKELKGKYFQSVFKKLKVRRFEFKKEVIKRFFLQEKLLVVILLFSFLARFWGLNYPTRFYFDEVYHAFTATEMAKGNVMAWEWWNQPPAGVAYEWTHPPLAKLLMTLGIFIFGENGFGWRFFGALLGTVCVFIIYLLGKELFNQKVALLAAFLFAFDGLPLVMSRIGMNDIYFLFFTLSSFWLFLKKKPLLSGLAFGLALASKWTAFYLLPVLALWRLMEWFKQERKKKFNFIKESLFIFLVCFLFLSLAVYLFSYLPFFLTGHTFSQWWELQHQMWWYHTGLTATHAYQSSALSWPWLIRPVWFFVDYQQATRANIYAMGNPLIWWGGLVSLPFVLWQAIKRRSWQLGLVIFAYLAFFLPWVFSPRIMFLYHYLPSVAFLCLFLGWFLAWLQAKKPFFFLVVGYVSFVVLTFFFFYPHWTGLHVPLWLNKLFYWLPSWR